MRILIITILFFAYAVVFAKSECDYQVAKLERDEAVPGLAVQMDMPYPKIDVTKIFGIFLHAVDQGQLKLFNRTLTRHMLEPLRVEYVYSLDNPYPEIRVFASLIEPLSMPAVPDVYIKGVSAVMDANGNIVDSIAHCDIDG